MRKRRRKKKRRTGQAIGSRLYKGTCRYGKDTQAAKELTFDDFDYGLTRLSYADNVEIVESYLPADQIQSLSDAKIF